jgi:hypothetical protein
MDKNKIVKLGMVVLGMALTAGANFVSSKNQEATMKDEIAKEVAKALSDQAKES